MNNKISSTQNGEHLCVWNRRFLTRNAAKIATLLKGTLPRSFGTFLLLPKIHKEAHKWTVANRIPPGRPIVSDVNSESYAISQFIDFHLAPYATQHPSYIKNTYDFLEKLQNIRTNPDALLISLDVDSLYTNLDNEMGMKAVTEAFNTPSVAFSHPRHPRPLVAAARNCRKRRLATRETLPRKCRERQLARCCCDS